MLDKITQLLNWVLFGREKEGKVMRRRSSSGISLIELMVAAAMMTIVAFISASILTTTQTQSDKANKRGSVAIDTATMQQQLMALLSYTTEIVVNLCAGGVQNITTSHLTAGDPVLHLKMENGVIQPDPAGLDDVYLTLIAPGGGSPGTPGELQLHRTAVSGRGLYLLNIAQLKCRYTAVDIVPNSGTNEPGQGAGTFRFWVTTKVREAEDWTDVTQGKNREAVFEFYLRNLVLGGGGGLTGNSGIRYKGGTIYFLRPVTN